MKLFGSITELVASVFRKDGFEVTLRPNQTSTYGAATDVQLPEDTGTSQELVGKNSTQTLTNKTLDNTNSASITDVNMVFEGATADFNFNCTPLTVNRIVTLNNSSGEMTLNEATQTLTNKTLDNTNQISLTDSQMTFEGATADFTFDADSLSANRIYTMPNAAGEVVLTSNGQTLTNKSLADVSTRFVDNLDTTKELGVLLDGATTSTATTLVSSQTANRSLTLPDATDTLVGKATTDTLTNKTMDGDLNTFSDIGITSLKTEVADKDNFIFRNLTTGAIENKAVEDFAEKTSAADADYFLMWDSVSGSHKKVSTQNFLGGARGYSRQFMMD